MALTNITGKIQTAWFEMLHGKIAGPIPVYRSDAASDRDGHYIVIRPESEVPKLNNRNHVTGLVIISEVVTKFKTAIDDQIAFNIDSEVASLLFPGGPGLNGLPVQPGIQIVEVVRQNATYVQEDDGVYKYNRIITRNVHRVLQT